MKRTATDKIADARQAFNVFRDELTTDQMRNVLGKMTDAQSQAAAQSGDASATAAIVMASIQLQRVIAANDRAALLAAVMATQSGVSRPQLDTTEGQED